MPSVKKILKLLLFFYFLLTIAYAQEPRRLHEMGKNYMIDGDYANAESLLYSAFSADTNNLVYIKDLSLCYFFQKDYKRSENILAPVVARNLADDQCYQLLGNVYKLQKNYEACSKIYTEALKKYPENGAFYKEIGELFALSQDAQCVGFWEKGIEKDPAYPGNYLNACKFYHAQNNRIWSVLYGEIYINLDPFSENTPEIKDILLEDYTYLLKSIATTDIPKDKNKFVQKLYTHLQQQSDLINTGIHTSTLTMIRTRFILDWYNDKPEKFPFFLFDHQRELLRKGYFEAYNQWLFGSAENLAGFQNWTQLHNTEYADFIQYQRSSLFRFPKGNYHH